MDVDIKDMLNNNPNVTKVDDNALLLDKIDDAKRYMSLNKFSEARIAVNEAIRMDKYNSEAWLMKYEILKNESQSNNTWIDNMSNDNFKSIVSSSVLECYLENLKASNNKENSSVVEVCNEIKSLIDKYNSFKEEYENKKKSDDERYKILERKINDYLGKKRIERVKKIASEFGMYMTAGTTKYGESTSFIYDLSDTEMFFYTLEGHPARYKSETPMSIDKKEEIFYSIAPKYRNKVIKEKKKFFGLFG
jgi:tetratricopeptide (TPR) repeat protein